MAIEPSAIREGPLPRDTAPAGTGPGPPLSGLAAPAAGPLPDSALGSAVPGPIGIRPSLPADAGPPGHAATGLPPSASVGPIPAAAPDFGGPADLALPAGQADLPGPPRTSSLDPLPALAGGSRAASPQRAPSPREARALPTTPPPPRRASSRSPRRTARDGASLALAGSAAPAPPSPTAPRRPSAGPALCPSQARTAPASRGSGRSRSCAPYRPPEPLLPGVTLGRRSVSTPPGLPRWGGEMDDSPASGESPAAPGVLPGPDAAPPLARRRPASRPLALRPARRPRLQSRGAGPVLGCSACRCHRARGHPSHTLDLACHWNPTAVEERAAARGRPRQRGGPGPSRRSRSPLVGGPAYASTSATGHAPSTTRRAPRASPASVPSHPPPQPAPRAEVLRLLEAGQRSAAEGLAFTHHVERAGVLAARRSPPAAALAAPSPVAPSLPRRTAVLRRPVGPELQASSGPAPSAVPSRSRSPTRAPAACPPPVVPDASAPGCPSGVPPASDHVGHEAPAVHALHPSQTDQISPSDLLASFWRTHADPVSGLSPLRPADARLHSASRLLSLSAHEIDCAVLEWVSVGAMVVVYQPNAGGPSPGGSVRWVGLPAPPFPLPSPPPTRMSPQPRRPLALLDLFSGLTASRLGIDAALDELHVPRRHFTSSGFVEIDQELVEGAERAWATSGRHGGGPSHSFVANNVWSLFLPVDPTADSPPRIDSFLATVPQDALLVLTSGSPCTQTSKITNTRGRIGLLGADSRHFWAVPLLAWVIQQRRPDLLVHVVQEMVATIQPVHLRAMLDALGVPSHSHLQHINSAAWGHLPRRRYWIATFPVGTSPEDTAPFQRLPVPWRPGWAFHWQGIPPTLTQSRDEHADQFLPSWYQGHPACLLYDTQHSDCWDLMSMRQVCNRIRSILLDPSVEATYPGAAAGYEAVLRFQDKGPTNEALVRQFVRWVAARGASLGFRLPSAEERMHATGFPALIQAFGLPPRAAFNAVGCHFDPRALHLRCRPLLRAWATNQPLPHHAFLSPSGLASVYARLRREARADAPLLIPLHDPHGGFAPDPVRNSLRRLGLWRDEAISVSPVRAPAARGSVPQSERSL